MTQVTDLLEDIIWQNSISIYQQAGIWNELRKLNRGESSIMTALDDLRGAVATVKQTNNDIENAVNDLVSRLNNNPSTAELEAITADLKAVADKAAGTKAAIDLIDPDTGGGVGLPAGSPVDGSAPAPVVVADPAPAEEPPVA